MADDKLKYVEELKSSSRPKSLTKAIIDLLDDIDAIYDDAISDFAGADYEFVSVRKTSAIEYNSFVSALDNASTRAIKKIDQSSEPLLSEVQGAILKDAMSLRPKAKKPPLPRTTRDNYVRSVKKYVNGQTKDLKGAAKKAARDWVATGSDITVLRNRLAHRLNQAKGHTGTVIRSELQLAYVDIVRDTAANLKLTKVRRDVADTACELCIALKGEHDADSDDAYELPHPNCACTFHPLGGDADMAGRIKQVDLSDLSHSTIRSLLQAAINAKLKKTNNYIYIRDVFDDTVVYDLETSSSGQYASKTYQCAYVIDTNRKVTLADPEEVLPVLSYEPLVSMAHFPLTVAGALFGNGQVTRRGKIFEAGDYPDKTFDISAEELQAAVDAFEPVDLDIEHMPTVLDGKLGQLKSVAVADDGMSLLGEVELPEWLHELIGNVALRVSTTWDRMEKRLIGLALVLNPRVSDAAVFSAFAGRRHSSADAKDFQSIHDLMVTHGAICAAEMSDDNNEEDQPMAGNTKSTATTTPPQPPPAATTATEATAEDAMIKRLQALEEQNARLMRDAIDARAAAFADTTIRDNRAYPSERPSIIDDYTQAALDDHDRPTQVSFAKGEERATGTRIEALAARYAARARHAVVAGGNGDTRVLENDPVTGEQSTDETKPKAAMSDERRKALLNKTQLGRAIASNGKSSN